MLEHFSAQSFRLIFILNEKTIYSSRRIWDEVLALLAKPLKFVWSFHMNKTVCFDHGNYNTDEARSRFIIDFFQDSRNLNFPLAGKDRCSFCEMPGKLLYVSISNENTSVLYLKICELGNHPGLSTAIIRIPIFCSYNCTELAKGVRTRYVTSKSEATSKREFICLKLTCESAHLHSLVWCTWNVYWDSLTRWQLIKREYKPAKRNSNMPKP